jgi:hypothetical protein
VPSPSRLPPTSNEAPPTHTRHRPEQLRRTAFLRTAGSVEQGSSCDTLSLMAPLLVKPQFWIFLLVFSGGVRCSRSMSTSAAGLLRVDDHRRALAVLAYLRG